MATGPRRHQPPDLGFRGGAQTWGSGAAQTCRVRVPAAATSAQRPARAAGVGAQTSDFCRESCRTPRCVRPQVRLLHPRFCGLWLAKPQSRLMQVGHFGAAFRNDISESHIGEALRNSASNHYQAAPQPVA